MGALVPTKSISSALLRSVGTSPSSNSPAKQEEDTWLLERKNELAQDATRQVRVSRIAVRKALQRILPSGPSGVLTENSSHSGTVEEPAAERIRTLRNFLVHARDTSSEPVTHFNVTGMQKWEGRVLRIDGEVFEAELAPLEHSGPVVHADFDVSQLATEIDPKELQPGDMFYVTVRTITEAGGPPTRTSALRLKRVGRWTEDELNRIKQRAARRSREFNKYVD